MANSGPMACPIDGTTLVMSERQGIEIDYCPSCRGAWLDRGELDKIIERNSAVEQPAAPPPPQPQGQSWGAPPPQQHYGHRYHRKPYTRPKSFLEELFH